MTQWKWAWGRLALGSLSGLRFCRAGGLRRGAHINGDRITLVQLHCPSPHQRLPLETRHCSFWFLPCSRSSFFVQASSLGRDVNDVFLFFLSGSLDPDISYLVFRTHRRAHVFTFCPHHYISYSRDAPST
jgi:hypothetical protein